MSWVCEVCKATNANVVRAYCVYCKFRLGKLTSRKDLNDNYDDFDEDRIKVFAYHLDYTLSNLPTGQKKMADDLFIKLFAEAKPKVAAMTDDELIAWHNELVKVCTEAKAVIFAIDDERRARTSKRTGGLIRSLVLDDESAASVEKIKERRKALSKDEKAIAAMVAAGISEKDAQAILSRGKGGKEKVESENMNILIEREVSKVTETLMPGYKPMINPFAKKD